MSKTQTLIKKLKDCCQMQPSCLKDSSSVVLNLVQDQTLLKAARNVGLLGSMDQLLWCERRVEQFMHEVFLLVATEHKADRERLKAIREGWFKVIEKELSNYGIAAELEDTEQQAKVKLEKAMKIYCTLPTEENLYEGDDML